MIPARLNRARRLLRLSFAAVGLLFFCCAGCVTQIRKDAQSLITLGRRMGRGMPDYNRGDELSDSDGDGQADAFDRYPADGDSVLFKGDRLVKSTRPDRAQP